jgi:hypothetical protein
MLTQLIRAAAFAVGALLFLGGLAEISLGGPDVVSGVWAVAIAAAIMVAAVLQRSGYRSEAAERSHATPGPGGGETGPMEPRFAPMNEVFLDPSSGLLMRVYEDSRSGERRYRAEG